MDILEEIMQNKGNKSEIESTLAKSLEKLIQMLSDITEFSQNELKALSLIESDRYFAHLLEYYSVNKKHLKRKHSKEILEALKEIAQSINANAQSNVMMNQGVKPNWFIR